MWATDKVIQKTKIQQKKIENRIQLQNGGQKTNFHFAT